MRLFCVHVWIIVSFADSKVLYVVVCTLSIMPGFLGRDTGHKALMPGVEHVGMRVLEFEATCRESL